MTKKQLVEMIRRVIREETAYGYSHEATELALLYITNERELHDDYSRKLGNITETDAQEYYYRLRKLNPIGFKEIHELLWPKANPMSLAGRGMKSKRTFQNRMKINFKEIANELNNLKE